MGKEQTNGRAKPPGKAVMNRIQEIETIVPVISATEAHQQNLHRCLVESITAEDIRAIIAKQKAKALEGENDSAKIILSHALPQRTKEAQQRQPNVNNTQVNIFREEGLDEAFLAEIRRQIIFILHEKPSGARPPQLAKELNKATWIIIEALNCPEWFHEAAGGVWHNNDRAEVEVIGAPRAKAIPAKTKGRPKK